MFTSKLFRIVLVMACCTVACEGEIDGDNVNDASDESLLIGVASSDGVGVEFRQAGDGGIFVSEIGSADAPSPVMYLAATADATPLEVFLALEPEQTPPQALVDAHENAMRENGKPLPPRLLSLPDPSFRSTWEDYYSTNCSYTSDKTWFDDSWDALGLEWHAYWSGTVAYTQRYSSASPTTTSFITHVCAYYVDVPLYPGTGDGYVQHEIAPVSGWSVPIHGTFIYNDVYPGYRSVLWIWNVSDEYRGLARSSQDESILRLGAMANE